MTESNFEHTKPLDVPRLFRSIFDGASANEIAVALYAEAAKGKMEGVWLGLRALQQKGESGHTAVKQLSTGNDHLAVVARELAENFNLPGDKLEELLGIKRWGTVLPMIPNMGIDFSAVHAHAVAHGYTTLSKRDMFHEYEQNYSDDKAAKAHTNGKVRKTTFNSYRTVGSHLPSYYELLGPVGILFLRMQESPMGLLLGTYGPYSSDDFGEMMRGINPEAEVHVVDINRIYTTQAEKSENRGKRNHFIITGDARALQYPDNSFNIICTNYLFGFLNPDSVRAPTYSDRIAEIKKVLESAFSALKPGGSLLLLEDAEKINGGLVHETLTKNKILQMAKEVGFRFERQLPSSFLTPLSKEQGILKPDEYGFVDYRNVLVVKDGSDMVLRLTKPRS